MTLEGIITNTGETAINNTKGQLLANGTITNKGNMGIINEGTGLVISKNAKIRSEERRVGKECRSRWSPYH